MKMPGVKYWYLSNRPPSSVEFARWACEERSRFSSICIVSGNDVSISYVYCSCLSDSLACASVCGVVM
jgi:hypothetical protein